jgi:type IV pilus biogenesis/stability protein PilW
MSLIIDALKKAQQLRLKGFEGSPILKYPHPDKKRGRGSKKQWSLIGAGFASLCILLFVLLRFSSPPLATQSHRAIVPMEKKTTVPVVEKISLEPSKKEGEPGEGLPHGEAAITHPPPQSQGERASSETKPSLHEKRKKTLVKQMPPSLPVATQKEGPPSKSIGVEQEGGKDRTLTADAHIHFNSGVSFYNQREFSKAIHAYQKVVELDPTYVEAYNNLGIIYQMMGDVERAFESYRKSTEINPRYEKGYNNLGILLYLRGRNEEALESFQKALAINPNNVESHINLGILFKKKGQWEKAIESYQKALAINPLHREALYNIALLYEQLGNMELAINHYQQFIQLSSKSHPELVVKVQRHLNALIKVREGK